MYTTLIDHGILVEHAAFTFALVLGPCIPLGDHSIHIRELSYTVCLVIIVCYICPLVDITSPPGMRA